MTIKNLLKNINNVMLQWVEEKKTGKVTIEINLSQGGIGQCRVRTERRLKDED